MLYTLKNQDACIHLLLYVYKKMGAAVKPPLKEFRIYNVMKNNQQSPGLHRGKS